MFHHQHNTARDSENQILYIAVSHLPTNPFKSKKEHKSNIVCAQNLYHLQMFSFLVALAHISFLPLLGLVCSTTISHTPALVNRCPQLVLTDEKVQNKVL